MMALLIRGPMRLEDLPMTLKNGEEQELIAERGDAELMMVRE